GYKRCGRRPEVTRQVTLAARGVAEIARDAAFRGAEFWRFDGPSGRRGCEVAAVLIEHHECDNVTARTVSRAQADFVKTRFEARRSQTVGLPATCGIGHHDQRLGAAAIYFHEARVRCEAGFIAFEEAAEVLVFERMEPRLIVAVVDGGDELRSGGRGM